LNPPLRASPCAAFGLAFSPLRPPLGGTSRPLSSGCGAGVATLLNPTPSRERGSLQRHQVLSRHKPLRFASLFIPRSLDPFSVQHLLLAYDSVKGESGSRSGAQGAQRPSTERVSISGEAAPLMLAVATNAWW